MPKAGYCKDCKKEVELNEDWSCQFGHPASSVIPLKKKKMGTLGLTVIVIVVLISLFICAVGFWSTLSEQGKETSQTSEGGLSVVDWEFVKGDFGTKRIIGTIKNNSSKEYSYVQVEFNLYDSNDNQVGSALANVNNLEPHGTWKFEAVVIEANAKKAKLKGISGF